MRGVDTNILLRFLTADDPAQTSLARELFETAEARGESFFVPAIVLCELVWALRGSAFRMKRAAIASMIEGLLDTTLFELQDRDLVRRALAEFSQGTGDFADYLLGWQNAAVGCQGTLTFDKALAGSSRFLVIESPAVAPRER